MQSPNSKQSKYEKHNSVTSINYIANGLIKKREAKRL